MEWLVHVVDAQLKHWILLSMLFYRDKKYKNFNYLSRVNALGWYCVNQTRCLLGRCRWSWSLLTFENGCPRGQMLEIEQVAGMEIKTLIIK